MVAEHALLAAHAVADAEAAVKKASNLLAAANALEELDCGAHDSNQGIPFFSMANLGPVA